MTFGEAFKKARKEQGAGGTFTWEGKKYSTNTAEDKAKVTKNNVEKKTEEKKKEKKKTEKKEEKKTDVKPVKKPEKKKETVVTPVKKPEKKFVDKIVDTFTKERDLVPDNIEYFLKDLVGIKGDYTEEDFGDTTLDATKTAVMNAIKKNQDYIGYGDYDDIQGSTYKDSIFDTISNPNKIAKTLIGAANFDVEDGNLMLRDSYDFNDAAANQDLGFVDKLKGIKEETFSDEGFSPYRGLRAIGKYFGSGEGGGSNINLNLGPASDYYNQDQLAGIMSTQAAKDVS